MKKLLLIGLIALAGCAYYRPLCVGGILGIPGVEYVKEKADGTIDGHCKRAKINADGTRTCISWHDRRAQFGVMIGANSTFSIFLVFFNPIAGGIYMGVGGLYGLVNSDKINDAMTLPEE